jgi:hypothetical protein
MRDASLCVRYCQVRVVDVTIFWKDADSNGVWWDRWITGGSLWHTKPKRKKEQIEAFHHPVDMMTLRDCESRITYPALLACSNYRTKTTGEEAEMETGFWIVSCPTTALQTIWALKQEVPEFLLYSMVLHKLYWFNCPLGIGIAAMSAVIVTRLVWSITRELVACAKTRRRSMRWKTMQHATMQLLMSNFVSESSISVQQNLVVVVRHWAFWYMTKNTFIKPLSTSSLARVSHMF